MTTITDRRMSRYFNKRSGNNSNLAWRGQVETEETESGNGKLKLKTEAETGKLKLGNGRQYSLL